MVRPTKQIPIEDQKGLKTLINEGKTQAEIAKIFQVDQKTISRRLADLKKLSK